MPSHPAPRLLEPLSTESGSACSRQGQTGVHQLAGGRIGCGCTTTFRGKPHTNLRQSLCGGARLHAGGALPTQPGTADTNPAVDSRILHTRCEKGPGHCRRRPGRRPQRSHCIRSQGVLAAYDIPVPEALRGVSAEELPLSHRRHAREFSVGMFQDPSSVRCCSLAMAAVPAR